MTQNNKNKLRATLLLTLGFVVLFVLIRNAPVEPCQVLHYGDYMNEEGAVENCGAEVTTFFDMTEIRYPIEVKLTPQGQVAPGQPMIFDLFLNDYLGHPIAFEDIAISHTERIHLMAVDPSLTDYRHLHPRPTGAPGHYEFELTPTQSGNYSVYLDFISLLSQRRVLVKTGFEVAGEAAAPRIQKNTTTSLDGYTYTLDGSVQGTFQAGKETQLQLSVQPTDGSTDVDFGLVMGAYAHLVVFDEAGKGFAHLHPKNPFIDQQDPKNPDLKFNFSPSDPGKYRLWAQFMIGGQERFVPFDLEVLGDV